jgi:hypothetical protein
VIPANPLRGIPGRPPTSELRAGLCKSQQTTIWTSQRPWQDFTHDNENGFATTVFTYGITLKHKGIETLWQAIMGRIDATAMVVVAMSAAKRTSSKRANTAPDYLVKNWSSPRPAARRSARYLAVCPFPSWAMRRNAASSRSSQSITSMSRTFNRPAQQASRSPPVGAVRGQDQPETATRQ